MYVRCFLQASWKLGHFLVRPLLWWLLFKACRLLIYYNCMYRHNYTNVAAKLTRLQVFFSHLELHMLLVWISKKCFVCTVQVIRNTICPHYLENFVFSIDETAFAPNSTVTPVLQFQVRKFDDDSYIINKLIFYAASYGELTLPVLNPNTKPWSSLDIDVYVMVSCVHVEYLAYRKVSYLIADIDISRSCTNFHKISTPSNLFTVAHC